MTTRTQVAEERPPTELGADVEIIRAPRRVELPDLGELWRYRHVFGALVWRNVARRYRQTVLGPIWFVMSPLFRMVIFSFVLGSLAGLPSDGVPYPLFTYAALLPWELFANGVSRSTASFVTYQHIISKIYFPRLIVPAAEVLTALVDFLLSFVVLLVMAAFYGYFPTVRMLALPLLLLLAMALALSVGLFLAALNARYRDVSKFVNYGLQFWFYGTPVAYSASVVTDKVPESLRLLFHLNPMNGVVEGFRWALLDTGRAPDTALLTSAGVTAVLLVIASIVFVRTEHSIVDLI